MSMKRNLAGVMFGLLGAGLLLTGCPEPGTTCAMDSDCGDNQICIPATGTCEFTCDSDTDCIGDERCLERPSDGAGYCAIPAVGEGCSEQDDPTQYCIDQLGDDDAICMNDACIIPNGGEDATFYVAYVHDVTTDRCDDMTYDIHTDGTKLMHVALLDSSGAPIAYGAAVEWYYGNDDVWYGEVENVLDGTEPNYDQFCPLIEDNPHSNQQSNFREDALAAIGCGGEVFVRFYDDDGDAILIEDGHIIQVNAYGQVCSEQNTHTTQSGDDFYNVYICEGPNVSRTQAEGIETDLDTCIRLNSSPVAGGPTEHNVNL